MILTISTPVFARDGAIPTLRKEIKEKRIEVRQDIKEIRTTKVQERQDKNLENKRTKAQSTLKRLRQGIVNRYENILKQKTNIKARIAKIESMVVPAGKTARDLTEAKAKLATFDDTKYKADLALFDAKVVEVLASDTPLKLTSEIKTLAKNLDDGIKSMRQILAETLRLMIKVK